MIFKAWHKTYDKAIKGDIMQSNMPLGRNWMES